MNRTYHQQTWAYVLFAAFSLIVFMLFASPLHSGFWGDDFYNLFNLSQVKEKGVLSFVLEGIAGPSGRPLSLLSFALQYENWPDDSYGFKLVNLIIHLLNGFLILIIVSKLLLVAGEKNKNSLIAALLCSALWVLHPIQFTTVLYAVQRMTQLSAFFCLSGIICYLYFRDNYLREKVELGLIGMSASILVFTTLAILSKENGVLLPLFILIIESTLLKDTCIDRRWKIWGWVFLAGPLFLLSSYLLINIDNLVLGYAKRHYTPIERLLTQAVILFDYLQNIFIPSPSDFSRYHDDFVVSRSLLHPFSTFLSCLGLIGITTFAILQRKRFVYLSFGILWFLGGHLLESSFLDLELYYEHRNYMPLLGPVLLISVLTMHFFQRYQSVLVKSLVVLYIACIFLVSNIELRTWDDLDKQSVELAVQQPKSYAAWTNLIDTYARLGYRDKMIEAQSHLETISDNTLHPYIRYLFTKGCYLQESIPEEKWQSLYQQSERKDWYSYNSVGFLNGLVSAMIDGNCPHVDPGKVITILLKLVGKQEYIQFEHMLHELAALLCIYMDDSACALTNIERSIELNDSLQKYLIKFNIVRTSGVPSNANQVLAEIEEYLDRNPKIAMANSTILAKLKASMDRISVK
jgi:protein O-mannosyl-transferase